MNNKISTYNDFLLTEITAQGNNLNKSFELVNGEIQKNSNAHMNIGNFRVLQFNYLIELDNYLRTLKSNQAIIAGVPKYKNMYEGNIVSKGNENHESNVISRTNKCFTETEASDIVIDFDPEEQMPEVMKNVRNEDDFVNLLIQILPEISEVESFIKKSSSSSVFNSLKNEFVNKDKFSCHLHLIATNCTKENLDLFIEYIKRKAFKKGLAYVKIHKDGSCGFRTLIDLSPIKSMASRLIFEAEATAIEPLVVKREDSKFYNINSKKALDLSKFNPNELPDYKEWYELEKRRLKPTIDSTKMNYKESKITTLIQQGVDEKSAEKIVYEFIEQRFVSCYDFLKKSDETNHKVIDLLIEDNIKDYFNDLVETNKKYKAYISKKAIFNAEVCSFARGGCSYKIKFDFNAICHLICTLNILSINYKNKCVLALEDLIKEDIFSVQEILKMEALLIENDFFTSNYFFKEKVFYKILEHKALSSMKNYAVLLSNGSFSIIDLTKHALTVYKVSDVKNFFKNKKIRGYDIETNKIKNYNPVDIWMESKYRKEFTGITFDPSMSCSDNLYNQFRGFKYQPQNLINIDPYYDLLKNVICSGDDFMFGIVWSFFAQIIQEPEIKMGVALIFLSKMGTGKGTAIQPIVELLDGYSLVTADSNTLFGRFTGHLSNCLLCYYNEASELNYNKSLISKFKNLTTEKIQTVEIKNGPVYSTPSCIRLVLDSNEDKLLQETSDSRRTWYPNISESRIGDKAYFKVLYDLFDTEGFYETLIFQLSTFDLEPWKQFLKNPIRNEVMVGQQLQSLNEICSWWLNCLQEGEIVGAYYELTTNGLKISNQELYNSYATFTRKSGKKVYDEKVAFGKMMKKYCISDSLILISNAKDKKNDNSKVYANVKECADYFLNKQKLEGIEMDSVEWKLSKRVNEFF
jgi:hypothetical protein